MAIEIVAVATVNETKAESQHVLTTVENALEQLQRQGEVAGHVGAAAIEVANNTIQTVKNIVDQTTIDAAIGKKRLEVQEEIYQSELTILKAEQDMIGKHVLAFREVNAKTLPRVIRCELDPKNRLVNTWL